MACTEKVLRNLSLVDGGQLSPFLLRLPKFLYIAEATAGANMPGGTSDSVRKSK